jgi:hypothetical protein
VGDNHVEIKISVSKHTKAGGQDRGQTTKVILCKLGINKFVTMVTDGFVNSRAHIAYISEVSTDRPLFYPNLPFLNSLLTKPTPGIAETK